jgi:hypothetical protein
LSLPKVVAINRFYAPDHSATAQLLSDLAEDLARHGQPVTVITSRLRYDDPKAFLPPRETLNGAAFAPIHIRRVWTTRFGRAGLWGRGLDYASFYLAAFLALLVEARCGDTILAKTDPPLLSIPAAIAARLKGARLVNWCQDLFPETAAALGLRWAAGPLGLMLRKLRNWSLRQAGCNVVLCDSMLAYLESEGLAPKSQDRKGLRIIHNWPDPAIRPLPRNRQPGEPFTICYSGNLGRAHDVDSVIELIERTRDLAEPETARGTKLAMDGVRKVVEGEERGGGDADTSSRTSDDEPGRPGAASATPATASVGLLWRFVGGGSGARRLRAHVSQQAIPNVAFAAYAPRSDLGASLGDCDAHLVTLSPACEGLIHPSKIYGILAAGRAALFLGSRDGSVAGMLREADAGLALDCDRPDTWRPTIEALLADAAQVAVMGRNARLAYERSYTDAHALAAWTELLCPHPIPASQPAEPAPMSASGRAKAKAAA